MVHCRAIAEPRPASPPSAPRHWHAPPRQGAHSPGPARPRRPPPWHGCGCFARTTCLFRRSPPPGTRLLGDTPPRIVPGPPDAGVQLDQRVLVELGQSLGLGLAHQRQFRLGQRVQQGVHGADRPVRTPAARGPPCGGGSYPGMLMRLSFRWCRRAAAGPAARRAHSPARHRGPGGRTAPRPLRTIRRHAPQVDLGGLRRGRPNRPSRWMSATGAVNEGVRSEIVA